MKKRRYETLAYQEKQLPNFISDNEERLRLDEMDKRDKYIRDEGLFEIVSKNLSESDITVYAHLFNYLEHGNSLLKK